MSTLELFLQIGEPGSGFLHSQSFGEYYPQQALAPRELHNPRPPLLPLLPVRATLLDHLVDVLAELRFPFSKAPLQCRGFFRCRPACGVQFLGVKIFDAGRFCLFLSLHTIQILGSLPFLGFQLLEQKLLLLARGLL